MSKWCQNSYFIILSAYNATEFSNTWYYQEACQSFIKPGFTEWIFEGNKVLWSPWQIFESVYGKHIGWIEKFIESFAALQITVI